MGSYNTRFFGRWKTVRMKNVKIKLEIEHSGNANNPIWKKEKEMRKMVRNHYPLTNSKGGLTSDIRHG